MCSSLPLYNRNKHSYFLEYLVLRVCLFGGKIGWMENVGKKMEKKIFFRVCLVGWEGRKINSRTRVFSPWAYQKVFFSKWRENWRKKMRLLNAHVQFIQFLFFFFGLSLFCFNWPSFFNKGVWVNLYKLIFSISLVFHSQQNKNERN